MLEALLNYIREKGFSVDVDGNILLIYKPAGKDTCVARWMLSEAELESSHQSILFAESDKLMGIVGQMMAQKAGNQ